MPNFQLVMHTGPTPGKTFPLEGDVITIGREANNTIAINDAEVSRKHAQLVFQGGKFIVTDIGSTNGTFVNGQRVTGQYVLVSGDVISLGEQISLLFESVVVIDPNATVISPASRAGVPPVVPVPAPAPAPAPVAPKPQPPAAHSYAGSVPENPQGGLTPPPAKSGASKLPLIIIAVVILCLLCSCAAALWFAPESFWCTILPFLFPGACG